MCFENCTKTLNFKRRGFEYSILKGRVNGRIDCFYLKIICCFSIKLIWVNEAFKSFLGI